MNLFEQFERMFGSKLSKRAAAPDFDKKNQTFVAPDMEGAISVDASSFGQTIFDLDAKWKSTADLISQYRKISRTPEAEAAIDDIAR